MHWFLYVVILTSGHAYGDYKARIPAPLTQEECVRLMGQINADVWMGNPAETFRNNHSILNAYCLQEKG
jgi:hypothetical protein